MELSSPKLKKLIFQEGTFQARKIKKTYSEKISHNFLNFLNKSYKFSDFFFDISRGNLQSPKTRIFYISLKKFISAFRDDY